MEYLKHTRKKKLKISNTCLWFNFKLARAVFFFLSTTNTRTLENTKTVTKYTNREKPRRMENKKNTTRGSVTYEKKACEMHVNVS